CSSVKIVGCSLRRLPVKTSSDIPKGKITDVMGEINKVTVQSPVHVGDVIIKDVLGLGVDIVSAKNM
ncbi:MAG: DUF1667 domain-containing protein, partial [Lachnospiraceae bacterium]|nr:DUF1667 domain-containing protein [Lachnospiraceae bacterium]